MNKKGQNIKPLNENEYVGFEVIEFTSGDGLSDYNSSLNLDETPIKEFSFTNESESNNLITSNIGINNSDSYQNNSLNTKTNSSTNKTSSLVSTNLGTSLVQKVRGLTPAIDGEAFDIKRCYQFRSSTLKKLNQLKGESDNINIYLNEIIDAAICYYYDSVFNNK